jgi:hypothetical protein
VPRRRATPLPAQPIRTRRLSMKRHPLFATLASLLVACGPADDAEPMPGPAASALSGEGVVEVVAQDLDFIAPDTVRAGWTTFRFTNAAPMIHFAVVERMPEGYGIEAQQEIVAPIFQEGYELLVGGDADAAMARFGELPEWFGQIVFMGGPGLTSPGQVSEATVYLEPGTYLLECYVKTDGVFHSYDPDPELYGMVHEFTVVGPATDVPEPTADLTLAISSESGISMQGSPMAGEQTVAVEFEDQIVHENFVGHDVHLVRVEEGTDLATIESWMDWTRADGLQSPAPAPFLGGLNEMPSGSTGYFTVTLEPGDYAWVSEVPGAQGKGLLVPFTVGGS